MRVAVDDFGTGYSSLSYLGRFAVDVLKVDRSFVVALAGGREAATLHSIIRLARSLRLSTVAEGIEDAEQLTKRRAYRADMSQGYHFAPPLEPAQFVELLSTPARHRASG